MENFTNLENILAITPKNWANEIIVPASNLQIISELSELEYSTITGVSLTVNKKSKQKNKVFAINTLNCFTANVGTSYKNKAAKLADNKDFQPLPNWQQKYSKNGVVVTNVKGNTFYLQSVGDENYHNKSLYFAVWENKQISKEKVFTEQYLTKSGLKPKFAAQGSVDYAKMPTKATKIDNLLYIKIEGVIYQNTDFQGLI